MDAIVTQDVSEIPECNRLWLEGVLGRPLEADQRVFIMVLKPATVPDDRTRREAAAGIRHIIAEAERNAKAQNVSDEEIDAAVEEAMAHVRI